MSHYYLKTKYKTEGLYESEDEHILYVHHNYDEAGICILSFDDTQKDNIFDAINKLNNAWDNQQNIIKGVTQMTNEEVNQIFNKQNKDG